MNRTTYSRENAKNHSKIKKVRFSRGIKAISASKVVFIILFVMGIYFSGLFINQQLKLNSLEARVNVLKEEINLAEKEKDNLLKEVELLHNPEYIEILARKELGLIKSGEVLFNVDKDRYVFKEKER